MKIHGRWAYLYWALDKEGNTIAFYLSPTRNAKAAKRFLGKALNGLRGLEEAAYHQHGQSADLRHRDFGAEGRR